MEMTQNVWKWNGNGNEVSKQTSKRWQILAKTKPDFQAEKPLYVLKFQHANRLVITSTNNFVPEKTLIPSLEHRNFLPCARYTEPWTDLEFENGIPKVSDDFGNGIETFLKTLEWK